jgi:hypothetical protein
MASRSLTGPASGQRVGASVVLCLLPLTAYAQARLTGADLEGTVKDESAAVLAGAVVTVINTETNASRTMQTDLRGHFRAPALPPGPYRVRVERGGFATQTRDGLALRLGQSAAIEIAMRLARAPEQTTVTAEPPVVDPGQTAVSSVVGQRQIENLPINRRNFVDFSIITPGVTTDRTPQQGATVTTGISFTGQRARSNNIMVDGLDNNDPAVGSVGALFSQEAVREFQVLTSSYPAEFGKASGGVVNIVTRSGANVFQGDVFFHYRDAALNAKEHFERFDRFGDRIDRDKAPYRQLQWGGVLGGPVRRDETFFFLSFERLSVQANNFVLIDPAVASVLRANGFPVELGNVPYDVGATAAMAKLNHGFSPESSLMVRAVFSAATNENIEPFGGIVARSRGAVQLRDDWSLSASQTNVLAGGWVNEARFQFSRLDVDVNSLDPNCNGPCGDDPSQGGPTLELPGIASVGRQRFTPNPRRSARYQLVETVSFFAGRHSAKAGVEFNAIDNEAFMLPLHFGGRYIFTAQPANPALGLDRSISAVEALSLGLPAAYVQGYGDPNGPYTYKDLSVFVQDQWKVGKLTIKPGLRYQKQFWPNTSFDISDVGGARFRYTFPPDSDNFAPRLAVALDPAGDGKTSVHAAYGLFFDNHITTIIGVGTAIDGRDHVRTLAAGLPAAREAWLAPGHRLPEPDAYFPSVAGPIDPGLVTPFAQQAAIGFDRALGRDLSLAVNFVYARGQHLLANIDYNPRVPSLGGPLRRPNDVNGVAGTSASVLQGTSFGETWYKGVTASLNKPFRDGYQFLASYTFSKAEDNTTDFHGEFAPERMGQGRNPADPRGLPLGFDPYHDRGPSIHDQRHRLVLSGLCRLPWDSHVSAIVTAASGRPFSALAGADLNGDGNGGAFPPDRARRDPADPDSSVGRNRETMPKQFNADLRLRKRFTLRGATSLDAIVEVFNVFNRVNFTEVNTIFGRGAFPGEPQRDVQGRVTYGLHEQALPPRQVQLALRFSF